MSSAADQATIKFSEIWDRECVEGSAIAPGLAATATAVRDELDIDPYTNEPTGWPIHEALGWEPPSRFWQTRKPHRFGAGAFLYQESGQVWQIKPANPRIDRAKGKPIKYETPKGAGSRAYLPPINRWALRRICRRNRGAIAGKRKLSPAQVFGVARAGIKAAGGFWAWVEATPALLIIVTEGGKKALSLLSQGYIAIALTGCNGGYQRVGEPRPKGTDGKRPAKDRRPIELTPDMAAFATKGRPITIAFDEDAKPETRRKVASACNRFGRLLARAGCKVAIARWDLAIGKGIDDVAAAHGPAAVDLILGAAIPLPHWQENRVYQGALAAKTEAPLGKYRPNLRVNVRDLAAAIAPDSIPQTGVVALVGGMGTAKTKLVARLINALAERGTPKVVSLGHRITLQRQLCTRLGLSYLGDCDRGARRLIDPSGNPATGVGLCVDSVLAIAEADFPPGEFDLVLDEFDQVLAHAIIGRTCLEDRALILQKLLWLIQNARRVILASATASEHDIDAICAVRGEQPWILQNDYQGARFPVQLFTNTPGISGTHSEAFAQVWNALRDALSEGRRVWVATDQKAIARQIAAAAQFQWGLSADETLVFSEDTRGEPRQKAFADAGPDAFIAANPGVRLVICTPSLTSGVSSEGDNFDLVFGFFMGQTISPTDAIQSLGRVRPPVPRIVFAALHGKGGDIDSWNAIEYRGQQHLRSEMIAAALRDRGLMGKIDSTSPWAAYAVAARVDRNVAMRSFCSHLRAGLGVMGHPVEFNPVTVKSAATHPDIAEAKRLGADLHHQAIAAAGNLDPDTYGEISGGKRAIDYSQVCGVAKYEIARFYRAANELDPGGDEWELAFDRIDAEAVRLDRNGRRRRQIRRLEGILYQGMTLAGDRRRIDEMTGDGQRAVLAGDLPRDQLATAAMERLGVPDFLLSIWGKGNEWTAATPSVVAMSQKLMAARDQVKLALGFAIHPKMPPTQVIGMLLESLAIATKSRQVTIDGKRARAYAIDRERFGSQGDPDRAPHEIYSALLNRAERHVSKGFQPCTHPLYSAIIGGVCSPAPEQDQVPPPPEPEPLPDAPPPAIEPPEPATAPAPPPSMDQIKAFLGAKTVIFGRARVYRDIEILGHDLVALAQRWGFKVAPAIAV